MRSTDASAATEAPSALLQAQCRHVPNRLEYRMLDTNVIVVVASTFLLAGMVKGVIGLGLPAVALGVLTFAFDLRSAMSLLLVPSFVTNLWQASVGGHGKALLLR